MPRHCAVPNCNGTKGFRFPQDPVVRKKWQVAIKRVDEKNKNKLWEPYEGAIVCDRHFKQNDFKIPLQSLESLPEFTGRTSRRLKEGTIPSVFAHSLQLVERSLASSDRRSRLAKRKEAQEREAEDKEDELILSETEPGVFHYVHCHSS
jgi:hypothetical protein